MSDETDPDKTAKTGCAAFIMIVLAIAIAWSMFFGDDDPTYDEGGEFDAIYVCEEEIKDLLRAPSTAKFGGESASGTTGGRWIVTGHVDAQNAFGGTVRNPWTCTATHVEGTRWRVSGRLIE